MRASFNQIILYRETLRHSTANQKVRILEVFKNSLAMNGSSDFQEIVSK